jgi:hypothetical protein
MTGKFYNIVKMQNFLLVLLVSITILITAQSYLLSAGKNKTNGHEYKHYNSYIIFNSAYFHLIGNKNLYQLYPDEQWDYNKYSPTFTLLMAPLANPPDAVGLFF